LGAFQIVAFSKKHYYENNKNRMRYKQYRNMGGGIIGSGAIESAHRMHPIIIEKNANQKFILLL
jgi:hypothetical protein